jgi:hypothetical protein
LDEGTRPGTSVYQLERRKLRMRVNNNENEEGPAHSAAGDCRILERQFAYEETAGLELLKRITLPSAMSAKIS